MWVDACEMSASATVRPDLRFMRKPISMRSTSSSATEYSGESLLVIVLDPEAGVDALCSFWGF